MNYKLLIIGSMYQGNLDVFYKNHPEVKGLDYKNHNSILLNNTTEFSGVYTRTLKKTGTETHCIIANDPFLQSKWEFTDKPDNPNNRLFDQINKIKPDVLWFDNITYAGAGLIEKVRAEVKSIKLIIAYHCAPYSINVLNLLRKTDFILTCTPGIRDEFKNHGLKAFLVYHGFDKDILQNLKPVQEKAENLVFSGSLTSGAGFHGNRISFIEAMLKEGVDINLYVNLESKLKIRAKQSLYHFSKFIGEKNSAMLGKYLPAIEFGKEPVAYYSEKLLGNKRPPVYGIDMYNLFNNSKIVLNFHVGAAGSWAGNMRLFEVTGIGSCLLTDNKTNLNELFDVGSEVISYENAEDCIQKAKWLLDNESEREKIANAGMKRTLSDHTVEKRCDLILDIIQRELKYK
jgi:spore maturation protein CgeB